MARLSPNLRGTHPSRTRSRVAPGGGGSRAAGCRRAVPSPPTPGAERPRRCPPVPLCTPRSGPAGNRRTRRSQGRGCDRGSTAPRPRPIVAARGAERSHRCRPLVPSGPVVAHRSPCVRQEADRRATDGPADGDRPDHSDTPPPHDVHRVASPLGLSPAGGPGKRCGRRPSGRTARRAP
jgi:hypothetical protein